MLDASVPADDSVGLSVVTQHHVSVRSRSAAPILEVHHVISLSYDGVDTIANVSAICPNDHRQAHFGAELEARKVEEEFIKKIALCNN